ncbi:MAG: hypothetical protein H0W02_21775 [Ktedonobacteraceae bacterium]|nr:hypothetical protein [Ktedonobacteraceae bacterium]
MFTKMQAFIPARHLLASVTRSLHSNDQEIKWFQDISLIVLMVTSLTFFLFASPPQTYAATVSHTMAANISCGNLSTGHCYGRQDWFGGTIGSKTDIKVVQLTCNGSCQSTGFLDNEMWLIDGQTSSCFSNMFGNCWVEGGYLYDGYCGFCYFWADVRPVDGNNLNLHYLYPTPNHMSPNRDIGHSMRISIYEQGTHRFEVDFAVQGCSFNCSANATFYSTNNTMVPNDVHIGTELSGVGSNNSNWGAPRADYTNNYWKNGAGWQGQTYGNGPGMFQQSPPYINGTYGSLGGTGGDFYTNCC